jgi:Kazal-type serine protease inhibitor domain
MLIRLDHMRTLSLGLIWVVELACSSGNEGETCGSIAGIHCAADEYCDFANNECGIADYTGTCKRRPEICPDIYIPTCACNGEVYSNECDAAAHGVDVSARGNCQLHAE